jgi:hypothetical protein
MDHSTTSKHAAGSFFINFTPSGHQVLGVDIETESRDFILEGSFE